MDTAPSNYGFNIKPNLCVYAKTHKNRTLDSTSCSLAELFIKIKKSETSDPFNDDALLDTNGKLRFVKKSKEAQETIGQILTYVAFQMGSQYRTHTFFILITGMYARLLRWDRSGVIVSEQIEYDKQHHLFSFFELFNTATPSILGWDESVTVPLKHKRVATLEVCPNLPPNDPLLVVEICGAGQAKPCSYVVASPCPEPSLPIRCLTHTSITYDVQRKKRVFMKDLWRIKEARCLMEGQVYQILNGGSSVPNVPTCLNFCDVGSKEHHQTHTQLIAHSLAVASDCQFSMHHHHRLILDTVGKKLNCFKSSQGLVKAIHDAIIGM
ncbi:hypothetical protein BJY52DRAFT_1124850 [Lactarius psammicola]|nr:hypothetical protein BJY52DRAFT_1124850 [Lactarius psammicola]